MSVGSLKNRKDDIGDQDFSCHEDDQEVSEEQRVREFIEEIRAGQGEYANHS